MLEKPGVALARLQRALVRAQRLGSAAARHAAQLRPREFGGLPIALDERALHLTFRLRRLGAAGLGEERPAEQRNCEDRLHSASTARACRMFAAKSSTAFASETRSSAERIRVAAVSTRMPSEAIEPASVASTVSTTKP